MNVILLICAQIFPFPFSDTNVSQIPDETDYTTAEYHTVVEIVHPFRLCHNYSFINDLNSYCAIPCLNRHSSLNDIFNIVKRIDRRFTVHTRNSYRRRQRYYMLNNRLIHCNLTSMSTYSGRVQPFMTRLDIYYWNDIVSEYWVDLSFVRNLHAYIITCRVGQSLGLDCAEFKQQARILLEYLKQLEIYHLQRRPLSSVMLKELREHLEREYGKIR